jgi:hypothetical protein
MAAFDEARRRLTGGTARLGFSRHVFLQLSIDPPFSFLKDEMAA